MRMFSKETGCCGPHLNESEITFLGATTLSFPLLLLSLPIFFISRIVSRTTFAIFLKKLIVTLLKSISYVVLLPQLKCTLSGSLFKLSPRLSGFLYKNFNLATITLLWSTLLTILYYVF